MKVAKDEYAHYRKEADRGGPEHDHRALGSAASDRPAAMSGGAVGGTREHGWGGCGRGRATRGARGRSGRRVAADAARLSGLEVETAFRAGAAQRSDTLPRKYVPSYSIDGRTLAVEGGRNGPGRLRRAPRLEKKRSLVYEVRTASVVQHVRAAFSARQEGMRLK
jgi:hypothetical protein